MREVPPKKTEEEQSARLVSLSLSLPFVFIPVIQRRGVTMVIRSPPEQQHDVGGEKKKS